MAHCLGFCSVSLYFHVGNRQRRVWTRFQQIIVFLERNSSCIVRVLCDWPEGLLWVWFQGTRLKTFLTMQATLRINEASRSSLLLHLIQPSLSVSGLISLWCFSTLVNYYKTTIFWFSSIKSDCTYCKTEMQSVVIEICKALYRCATVSSSIFCKFSVILWVQSNLH